MSCRCACNNVFRLVAASLFTIFISTCTMINFKLIVSKMKLNKKKYLNCRFVGQFNKKYFSNFLFGIISDRKFEVFSNINAC